MKFNSSMVTQIKGKPPSNLSNGDPFVGLSKLVAPLGKNAKIWHKSRCSTSSAGDVSQLSGRGNASPKMAPAMHNFVRASLQAKQVSPEGIDQYLSDQKSLQRYDSAFKIIWSMAKKA